MSVLLPFTSKAAEAGVASLVSDSTAPEVNSAAPPSPPANRIHLVPLSQGPCALPAPARSGRARFQSTGDRQAKLEALRGLLADKQVPGRQNVAGGLNFGVRAIDAILGSGLQPGALCELVERHRCAGLQTALLSLLGQAARSQSRLALVEAADRFDPSGCPAGTLRWLLWVRALASADALRAIDALAQDGSLPLLALDLRDAPARDLRGLSTTVWHRLRRAIETSGAVLFVMTSAPLVSSAALRLELVQGLTLSQIDQEREQTGFRIQAAVLRRTGAWTTDQLSLLSA